MYAIASCPGIPVRQMWQEKAKPDEKRILPPPALGKFGISENRFSRLTQLLSNLHSVSEAELDQSDPWRYCNLPIDCHNEHLMSIGEKYTMPHHGFWRPMNQCPLSYQAQRAMGMTIFRSCRMFLGSPNRLGLKLRMLQTGSLGESGVILLLELALKHKRKRQAPQVVQKYADEPGVGTHEAQLLRLTVPWHNSGRAVGADSHFMSVASVD